MCYRVVATATNAPTGMVLIPGGTNTGTDPDFSAYSLTVGAFYMDQYEVTKTKRDEVFTWAVANGYSFDNVGAGKASNHPVCFVSWYDCVTWCNARSQKDGRTPCYNLSTWVCNFSANGYRLPTNMEWEYAARGGLSGKRFPWGDTVTHTQANYYGYPSAYTYDLGYPGFNTLYWTGSTPYTSPVGSFTANGYGLYDMAGNVWEWCNDTSGSSRYFRSGSWDGSANYLRCGYKGWDDPNFALNNIGLRAVCR